MKPAAAGIQGWDFLDEAETAVLQERLAHLESATTQVRALVEAFLSRA